MPGCFKKIIFSLAAACSFASFVLIIVAMATQKWMTGKILCQTGVDLVNASDPEMVKFIGDIYYGLFQGGKVRRCGLGKRTFTFKSLFIVFAVTSFIAAVQLHNLTERIANFRENVFRIVILEENYEDSFWVCVASGAMHAVNMLLMAATEIRLPKIKTKTEEANVTAEDIMY
ncbi:clarin-2 [Pyxicephalus adspersus]|uniref:clarin-2 n=1 Tax=Pyxicephalus adspersus TaxID=30357 RepID=UPI003B5BCD85